MDAKTQRNAKKKTLTTQGKNLALHCIDIPYAHQSQHPILYKYFPQGRTAAPATRTFRAPVQAQVAPPHATI